SENWRLNSPPLDAQATSTLLAALGFDVDCKRDLSFDAMNTAIDGFAQKLKAAANVGAALFYYSGHGCARERQNYMFPTDFDDHASADDKLVLVQSFIDKISSARAQEFVKIVLFDACRSGDEEDEGADYQQRLETAMQGKSIRRPDGASNAPEDIE